MRLGRLLASMALAIMSILVASDTSASAVASGGICDLEASWLDVDGNCVYSATVVMHALSTPGPVFHYRVEPVCRAEDNSQGVCVNPYPCLEPVGTFRFAVFRWTDGTEAVQIGTVCFDQDESEDLGAITMDAIIKRTKALDWPSAELVIEPPNGRTLVNLPTNFYTELTAPVVLPVHMLHHLVEVQATPTSYAWHFGDGSDDQTGTDPGASYAQDSSLRVNHVYVDAKVTVQPSVDVTYVGAYRIDGGPWRPIPTTLTVAGAQVELRVLTATPRLVG
jgi:hypothetical protein